MRAVRKTSDRDRQADAEKLRRKKVRFFNMNESELSPALLDQLNLIRKGPGKRLEGGSLGARVLHERSIDRRMLSLCISRYSAQRYTNVGTHNSIDVLWTHARTHSRTCQC